MNTEKLIRSMKPRPQNLQPIATDMFLPNHSGISGHPEAVKTFVLKTGDTMTGALAITSSTNNYFFSAAGTSSQGRDILIGTVTYNGSFIVQNGLNYSMTCQGTGTFAQTAGARVNAHLDQDSTGISSTWGIFAASNLATGRAFTKTTTRTFYGGQFSVVGNASSHTNTTFLTHSIQGAAAPSIILGSGSSHTHWAGNFLDDIQVSSGKKIILEGSATAKGDTYLVFQNSRIEFFLNGTLEGYIDTTGFVSA